MPVKFKEIGKIARPKKKKKAPSPAKLLKLAQTTLEDDKAIDLVVIDLAGKAKFTDYMLIATGTSRRHVATMADHLRRELKAGGIEGVGMEGLEQCDWVLIDGGGLVVHLFRPEVREFYEIEKIWREAATGRERSSA